jgi:hypothetical protein
VPRREEKQDHKPGQAKFFFYSVLKIHRRLSQTAKDVGLSEILDFYPVFCMQLERLKS